MRLTSVIALLLGMAAAPSAIAGEVYFAWNGDQGAVLAYPKEGGEWVSLGNKHAAECDFEVQKVNASVGERLITLPSGRRAPVHGLNRSEANNLWASCMGSKGWERVGSAHHLDERLRALRDQGRTTSGMIFQQRF